jgi:hypothetical protein
MVAQRRPARNVDLLLLRRGVVLQQRLAMFPAREAADALAELRLNHVDQIVAASVAEDCALHVRGLQLPAVHQELAVGVDHGLGDVERVVVVFREAERDDHVVLLGTSLNGAHFGRVDGQGILDLARCQSRVDGAVPIGVSVLKYSEG